jgi:phosphatidylinositol alpha-1,6-mannosyltransferase
MKRILLTTQIFAPPLNGGSVVSLHEVFRRLQSMEVTVLAPATAGDAAFDHGLSYRVIRSRVLSRLGPSKAHRGWVYFVWLLKMLVLCRQRDINYLHIGHAFTGYEGLVGLAAARAMRIPCFFWIYGEDITKSLSRGGWRENLGRWMLKRANGVLANSRWTKERIVEFLGESAPPVAVVYPGVDTNVFRPDPQASRVVRRKLNLPDGPFLLSASRLERRKGLDLAIEAVPIILREYPQASLVIVGRGPEEESLRGSTKRLGVADRVVFAGYVSTAELALYYAACDVFVVPTLPIEATGDTEGFGMVFIEANACGKPVVAGCSGATVEAVQDGVTGLLIDVRAADDVAGAVLRLLRDPHYASCLAQNGLERVRERFTWDRSAQAVEEFCCKVESALEMRKGHEHQRSF